MRYFLGPQNILSAHHREDSHKHTILSFYNVDQEKETEFALSKYFLDNFSLILLIHASFIVLYILILVVLYCLKRNMKKRMDLDTDDAKINKGLIVRVLEKFKIWSTKILFSIILVLMTEIFVLASINFENTDLSSFRMQLSFALAILYCVGVFAFFIAQFFFE